MKTRLALGLILVSTLIPTRADAQIRRTYREGRFGPATLQYVDRIPVLKLYGTPEEMGEQAGRLVGDTAVHAVRGYLGQVLAGPVETLVLERARIMERHMPEAYRAEMAAFVEASPLTAREVLLLNTFADIKKVIFCTTVAVSRERSATGTPLLARNFDFPSLGVAEHFGLVVVYHPTGKKAFASITHPGVVGTHSFLNEDGLAGAVMEVHGGAHRFSAEAMPALMLYRSIAESTDRVDEGLALLKRSARPSSNNLMLVEASGRAAVAEFTTRDFAVRRPENGLLFSTNHHRSPELGFKKSACPRMRYLLEQAAMPDTVWNVESLKTHLKKTALGRLNLYSIVFLPEKRCFHLAAGRIPAANEPFVVLDKKALFEPTLRRRWL